MGSSIDIDFASLQYNTSVIGFGSCIVIDCDQCFLDIDYFEVGCEYYFDEENDFSKKLCSTLKRRYDIHFDDDSNLENNILDWSSDLVFIWHLYDRRNATWALFKFYFRQSNGSFGKDRVKQCEIPVLFRQDANELNFIEHVPI